MNTVTTSRLSGIFALIALLLVSNDLHAQPAGGKWYQAMQTPLLANGHMVFADSMTGYYIGFDTGYVTKDGAQSWTPMNFPANARPAPSFLFAPDHNTVMSFQEYAVDSSGVALPGVIASTDMGSTWSLVSQNSIPKFTKALTMWTAKDGFRIWLDNSNKDVCAVTHDGGKTFTDIRGDAILEKYISKLNGSGNGHLSIQSDWSDSLHGVVAVGGTGTYPVLLTSNGGRSWSEHYMKYQGDSSFTLSNAYLYPGSNSVWVMPSTVQTKALQGYFFYYSSDFGVTWTTTDTVKSEFLYELAPVSATAAWVVVIGNNRFPASSQNVIAYKDISANWKYIDTVRKSTGFFGPAWTIKDIQFTDPNHGWVRAIFVPGTDTITNDQFAHFFRFVAGNSNGVLQITDPPHLHCTANPASDIIKIDGIAADEKVRDVKCSNSLGKQCSCQTESTETGVELDVRDQPNGCYFVTVATSLRTKNIAVIVMH